MEKFKYSRTKNLQGKQAEEAARYNEMQAISSIDKMAKTSLQDGPNILKVFNRPKQLNSAKTENSLLLNSYQYWALYCKWDYESYLGIEKQQICWVLWFNKRNLKVLKDCITWTQVR